MGHQLMDKPPTKAKPSAEAEDAPERLDTEARRAVIGAAETCRERFDASPSRSTYQLATILDALGHYPHLIDPVYRFMESKDCPSKEPGIAAIVKIAGVEVRRLVQKKDDSYATDEKGLLVYQRIKSGRQWEGPSMVNKTRIAIDDSGADPLYVAAFVVRHLPPLLRADCRRANRDPIEIGQEIAELLIDDGSGKRKQGWRDPEAVLRAILRELGHPRPDNLTR
jgi:hypothetical protein